MPDERTVELVGHRRGHGLAPRVAHHQAQLVAVAKSLPVVTLAAGPHERAGGKGWFVV